jgi:hypothetical protein
MNVKAGDLAITVNSEVEIENIGIVCDVIKYVPAGIDVSFEDGSLWESASGAWHVKTTGRLFKVRDTHRTHALFYDKNLRPVSGIPDEESTEDAQPVNLDIAA